MSEDKWNDETFVNERIASLKEAIGFFSPQRKQERELWVGHELLSYLGLTAECQELKLSADEPPDLLFKEAKFELKEIMDEGWPRGREYKEALKIAEKAKNTKELLEESTPKKMKVSDAVLLVNQKASSWSKKYAPDVTRNLDLLFYLNLQDYSIIGNELSYEELEDYETLSLWRSVTVVSNDCAFVLFTNNDAPEFLKVSVGSLYRKNI